MKKLYWILTAGFLIALEACTIIPAYQPAVLSPPPPMYVEPLPPTYYVAPWYESPGPGWVWRYHPNYGWGYQHPQHGWYHRGRR